MDEAARIAFVKDTLCRSVWHLETLRAVREMALPDWAIGAGFVRSLVWDRLHGFEKATPLNDIDVLFFDPEDTRSARELEIEAALTEKISDRPWSVRNQARMHLRNGDRPYTSTADALCFWLETPTCVAVRLGAGDEIDVIAPFGLSDLIDMRIAPTARGRVRRAEYEERVARKNWLQTWPKATSGR